MFQANGLAQWLMEPTLKESSKLKGDSWQWRRGTYKWYFVSSRKIITCSKLIKVCSHYLMFGISGCFLKGSFTDFNVWDSFLSQDDLEQFTLCKYSYFAHYCDWSCQLSWRSNMVGNILPWDGNNWEMSREISEDEYQVQQGLFCFSVDKRTKAFGGCFVSVLATF